MRSDSPTFTERARRSQIVACAIEVIAELGYPQASVRKIADRAGVAMSVVLYHFGNKAELVAAVVSECYRSLLEMMVPAVEAEASAPDKLSAHIRTHLTYIATNRAHQTAIMEIANGFRGPHGERMADLPVEPEHLDGLAKVDLEVIIRQGVDSGQFRHLSPESIAMAVRGALGVALLRTTSDDTFDLVAYGDDLIDAFLRACAPDTLN